MLQSKSGFSVHAQAPAEQPVQPPSKDERDMKRMGRVQQLEVR